MHPHELVPDAAVTVVIAVAELFPGAGSAVVEETDAVSLIGPAAVGVRLRITAMLDPLGSEPKLQIKAPPEFEQSPLGVALSN
jgi:hypothetical protein